MKASVRKLNGMTRPSDNIEQLRGLVVPILTPFDRSEKVDPGALRSHLDYLTAAGVKHVLLGGTTGEFFSMTPAERVKLLEWSRPAFAGTLLLQVGGGPLGEAIELARAGQQHGADVLISLPPAYFADAPPEGLVAWFSALAGATALPLLLYNFPRHTGNALTAEILAAVPHAGLKDSSGQLDLIAATPKYFVGGDSKILAAVEAGAVGYVSAIANAFPQPFIELADALDRGDPAAAEVLHRQICELPRRSGPAEIPAAKAELAHRLPDYPTHVRPPLLAAH
jgi:4-hydroxy-tetrahydrodipicolinate synthase